MFGKGGVLGEWMEHVAGLPGGGGVAEARVAVVMLLALWTIVDSVTSRGGEK